MKSLETQLQEKEQELRELRGRVGKSTIVVKLTESGLPTVAQARLRKRFEESGNLEELDRAITEEREYVSKVRKAGARGQRSEQQESNAQKQSLVESYQTMGLSEHEAKLAAGVENAVKDVNESEQRLFESAKAMGMSDAEAKAFAGPKHRESW